MLMYNNYIYIAVMAGFLHNPDSAADADSEAD